MDRRSFLAATAWGVVALAGCVRSPSAGASGDGTAERAVESVAGVSLPVPEDDLRQGSSRDGIPAIVDPAFGDDWSGIEVTATDRHSGQEYTVEPRLEPGDRVIGVERGSEAHAYPLKLLDWHEVVNDTLDGPLLVTYCPLCGSGVVAERTVRGEETVFGVSGLLFRSNLVMYDRATESLWSQVAATAISGPATGETLELVPSTITTWSAWRAEHPGTRVLLPPPASNTVKGRVSFDYEFDPYGGYDNASRIGVAGRRLEDDRLHPKEEVIGVADDGTAKAYPLSAVAEERVVNDAVGDLPVVVAVGPDGRTLVAYDRRLDGAVLEFEPAGDAHLRAGGSRWTVLRGRAVDGPHEGTRLAPATDLGQLFWFSWLDFHPETAVYG